MRHPILRQSIEELREAAIVRPLRIEVSSCTLSDSEMASMVESLKGKGDVIREVQIVVVAESSSVDANVFARLLISHGKEDRRTRRQPPNEAYRQIRFHSDSVGRLEQDLDQFFVAVLG
jgi:hypothetical protein